MDSTNLRQPTSFELYKRISNAIGISDYSSQIIHYTGLQSLERILQSQSLWFGRSKQMNDSTECDHFLDGVLEHSERLLGDLDTKALEMLIQKMRPAIRDESFISSWCEYFDAQPNGKLSMWRAYASNGFGIALVVDSSQLQPSSLNAQKLGFHVYSSKVEYVRKDRAIDAANKYLQRISNVPEWYDSPDKKIAVASTLLGKAPCVKHDGFAEEEEVRFLYLKGLRNIMGHFDEDEVIETTGEGSNKKYYFAMPLKEYPDYDFDLRPETILKKVIIGPLAEKSATAERLSQLLKHYQLGHVQIQFCDIPLR